MRKFWIVFSHTYLSRVKAKGFIITSAIFLLLICGLFYLPDIIERFSGNDEDPVVAVIDETENEQLYEALHASADGYQPELFEGTEEAAKQAVEEEDYEGLLVLRQSEQNLPEAAFYSMQLTNEVSDDIESQLQQVKVAQAASQAGIDEATIQEIYTPVSFEREALDEEAKTEEELAGSQGLVYILVFGLYMSVIIYGMMIATDISNEKSSRVMEILISSSSPVSQMFAKILAIGLVGLTQVALIAAAVYTMVQVRGSELDGGFIEFAGIANASPITLWFALIFFILGYFLYATICAGLGSVVSRMEDVQQLVSPVIFLVVAAFILSMYGLGSPDSPVIVVTSYIPFFTPMIMFLRIGVLGVPAWEAALGIAILVATILVIAWISAKVYRGGVLMYGKGGSFSQLKQALKLSGDIKNKEK
ncbi:ABC-2 type transport system permease protein [Terribacillus aidingensis]|uniref:ABC-2 type transport system permease protein n=1 Tax=Terribacillus aidingensis TaxID=586416 RepID=A0A285N463_9BACI|nr:ABC transporter permease [Terribacillus aidingensis]SNZ04229.1 ABC-2 type transport system permease protein [Terribacillus aidingensis]